jgi:hypothetical protein
VKLWSPDLWHPVMGRGQVLNPDGSVAWEESWQLNAVADEGEKAILDVFYREQANVAKYLALLTAAPSETTTMATMTELGAGVGYSRQQIAAGDWSAPALDAGDMQTQAAEKTFGPATGAWAITHVAIVTVASGTGGLFLQFLALSANPTNIASGQSFKYTYRTKAQ